MALETGEYLLSCELRAHEDDVRGICICGDFGIATSSRDRTVRFWSPDPDKKHRYVLSKTLAGHSSFVGPLAWIPPSDHFPEGGIVSGGMDTIVLLWDLRTGEVVDTMKGHQLQVTGLTVDDNGDIISSSIDCTIRRWRKGHAIEFWEAHKVAVQAVVKLPSGELITGLQLSDGSPYRDVMSRKVMSNKHIYDDIPNEVQVIRLLSSGEEELVYTLFWGTPGFTDTVRGLAVMPGFGVLSASHDCSIRLWALTGQLLLEMIGHTSLVYSVDAHSSGLVASGSEDCFLKIWRDGKCVQSIEHPGCVWDAKFLENGDIVTACSDGIVRIWTSHKDRISEPLELEAYAIELSQYKSNRKKVGGIKLADLPGLEALRLPVYFGGLLLVEEAIWASSFKQLPLIVHVCPFFHDGRAVSFYGSTDGQTIVVREGDNGIAYSWNSREQKWDKIGEVVDGPGDGTNNRVLDGIQYDYVFDVDIGDGEPIRKLPYNRGDNPYTTADKWLLKENLPLSYRQQVVEFILQNTGQRNFSLDTSFRDPYTGSSAYIPGEPSVSFGSATKPTFKHIPKKGMLLFDTAQFDGILKKIADFNTGLLSDMEQKSLSLTESELSRVAAIVKILKDTSHYHCNTFADIDIVLLLKILKSWPISMMFPVIDILRMIILHPNGASLLLKHIEEGNDVLMETFKKATVVPAQAANLLTVVRAIANLFKHSHFSQWLQLHCSEILDALSSCQSFFNKNVHISYSTLVLNFAVLSIEMKDKEGQAQVLSAALEIAEDGNQDVDSRFRALVAIGSLMLDGLVKSIAIDFDVQSIAKDAKASKIAKLAEVGADIELIVKST